MIIGFYNLNFQMKMVNHITVWWRWFGVKNLSEKFPKDGQNQPIEISNMYQPNTFDAKLLEDDGKYRVYGAGGYMGQYHDFNHKESEIFISCGKL